MSLLISNRDRLADELREEMESHIQEKAEALVEQGLSPSEAMQAARRTFGNQARIQDEAWHAASNAFIDAIMTDISFAFAQLRRSPLYTLAAIVILAVGIGANTAVFAVLYEAAFRMLPVQNPERLALIQLRGGQLPSSGADLTLRMFEGIRRNRESFEDVSGWIRQDRVTFEDVAGRPHTMNATLVSGNGFDTLGILPEAGRLLAAKDDEATSASWPVVLSDALWAKKYQRDPSVIGKSIRISGQTAHVVGVVPANFEGITPNLSPEMYLPLGFLSAQRIGGRDLLQRPDFFGITVLGRLRDGVSLTTADTELSSNTRSLIESETHPQVGMHPDLKGAVLHARDGSYGLRVLAPYRRTLISLQILTAAGLLFCCINVSGLQMTRRMERAHEFSVRSALGGTQGHLVRQSLAETSLIALAGAGLAIPITFAVSRTLGAFLTAPGAGDIVMVHPNWTAFVIAGAFAALCAVAVGLVPIYLAGQVLPADVLHPHVKTKTTTLAASRTILFSQITLCFLLVSLSTSSFRSLKSLYASDLGYDPRHVTEVCAQFHELQKSPGEILSIYRQMLHALNAQRDIDSATLTWITQLTTVGPTLRASAAGTARFEQIGFNAVGPGYFSTLRTPLLQGREFVDEDTTNDHCIVNELAAALLFPSAGATNAIGRKVTIDRDVNLHATCEVVGVVQATKFADVHQPKAPILFLPITESFMRMGEGNMVFLLRGEPEKAKEAAYLNVLSQVAPGTGYLRFLPMERQLNDALGRERLVAYIEAFFAVMALLLCSLSTFFLMQMRLLQNIPQIALRVALGATPLRAASSIVRELSALTVLSVGAGGLTLGTVVFHSRVARLADNHVSRGDAFCALCTTLFMMLCAGGLPAIRAGTLHPMRLLRRDS